MANILSLTLMIVTLFTGILWCMQRVKLLLFPRRLLQLGKKIQNTATIKKNSKTNSLDHPTWIENFASIFPVLLMVFMVRSFIFEPFQIPSGSMMSTLLVGDFILVEKFAYGIKDPITQTTLIKTGHPKRGDIVVFKYPPNPKLDYVKRVIGLPGDLINYDPIAKHITIHPGCLRGKNCNITPPITYSDIGLSHFVQTFNFTGNGKITTAFLQVPLNQKIYHGIRLAQQKESLGNVIHDILTIPGKHDQVDIYYRQTGNSLGEWIVPQGEYFMMGDNRDNSADSRFWGFVPEKNLVGKAKAIWISFDKQEGHWPTGVRFSRIGSIY